MYTSLDLDILDNLMDNVIILSPVYSHSGLVSDFCFEYVNEAASTSYQIPRKEAVGNLLLSLFPDYQQNGLFELCKKAFSNDTVERREDHYHFSDRPSRFLNIRVWKKQNLLFAVWRDVTEQVREREELERSIQWFDRVFQFSPVAVALCDRDQRFTMVNNQFQKMFSYTADELSGLNLQEWACLDKSTLSIISACLHRGIIYSDFEITARDKTGRDLHLSLSVDRITLEGGDFLIIVAMDITPRLKLWDEIARLERLNNIAQIAAGIGHEVRNPLTAVKGFLQMFLYNPDFREYIDICDMMISELDRANDIISEFLSLSKADPENPSQHNLNTLINEIHPLINSQAILQDKRIVLELNKDIEPCLLDQKEFRQLLLNMISNALDATPEGKAVTVSTFNRGAEVAMVVEDQGSGMDSTVLQHLGEPFVTTKEEGTGLGLATCFSIVKRHRGHIEVDSSDQGTCFTVYFPRAVRK